jgi:hypothetical protein
MDSSEGHSKFRTSMKNVKVNEPVEFKWKEIKNK